MLINVGALALDIPANTIVESRRSGILVRGEIIPSGVDPFTLPRTPNNDQALFRVAFPESERERPNFLAVTCDFGPYDRIYVDGYDSSGFRCRLVWSDDPIRRASETALSDLNIGTVQINRPYIESRQDVVAIPIDADKGDQWPDVYYGHFNKEYSNESSPHMAYGMYRPWLNPHWLLRKAFNFLGYGFAHPVGNHLDARQDIAYLLNDDIGSGDEPNRGLKLDEFKPITTSPDLLIQTAFNDQFNDSQAIRRLDPDDTWTGAEWYPESGYYEFTLSGRVVMPMPFGVTDEELTDAPQVRFSIRFGQFIVREWDVTAVVDKPGPGFQGFFTFNHKSTVWISKGSHLQIHVRAAKDLVLVTSKALRDFLNDNGLTPSFNVLYGWNDGAKGLTFESKCLRSWYRRGQTVPLQSMLRRDISVLQVLEAVCHMYGLRVDYDLSTRTVTLLPAYPTELYGSSVPGYYTSEESFPFPFDRTGDAEVTFQANQRPTKVTVGLSGSDETAYNLDQSGTTSQLQTEVYTSNNPLFRAVDTVNILMPRIQQYSQLNTQVQAKEIYAAPLLEAGEPNDETGPEYEIEPIIARYFGRDLYQFLTPPEGVSNIAPILPGLAVVTHPETQPNFTQQVATRDLAFAALVPDILQIPDEPPSSPGKELTYRVHFDPLMRRDLLSRYNGVELAQQIKAPRLDIAELDYSKRYSLLTQHGVAEVIVLAAEQIDDNTATLRMVALADDVLVGTELSPCAINSARVNISVNTSARTASATFVIETGDNAVASIVYEYRRDGGPWLTYTPATSLPFVDGTLEFRVTIEFETCPTIIQSATVDASAYSTSLCGGTPGIDVVFNAADNWVEAVRAADIVPFGFSDLFEVSIDGGAFAPYTSGIRIDDFERVVFRRRAQVSADCPVREFTRTVTAEDPGTGVQLCTVQPTLTAQITGPGVSFGVDQTGVTGDIQFQISVLQSNATRWVDYNGVPVRVAGKVALITRYANGCPDTFKMYTYTLAGVLTAI